MNINLQGAAGAAQNAETVISGTVQQIKQAAAASALASLSQPGLADDQARMAWADDNFWHRARAVPVFGIAVDWLRHQSAINNPIQAYIVSIIQADELAASLAGALTAPPAVAEGEQPKAENAQADAKEAVVLP